MKRNPQRAGRKQQDEPCLDADRLFGPSLAGYARNLLVATGVGRLRDVSGDRVAASTPLFQRVVDDEIEPLAGEDGPAERLERFLAAAGTRLRPPDRPADPARRNLRVIGDGLRSSATGLSPLHATIFPLAESTGL